MPQLCSSLAAAFLIVLPASSAHPAAVSRLPGHAGPTGRGCGIQPARGRRPARHRADGRDGQGPARRSQADYVRDLRRVPATGPGSRSASGTRIATAVDQVATAFPARAFAIVDVDVRTLIHRPANVEGLLFKEQEAGYLAGYAAGLWASQAQATPSARSAASTSRPWSVRSQGFGSARSEANPGIEVLTGYSGDFAVPAKCAAAGVRPDREGLGGRVRGRGGVRRRCAHGGARAGRVRDRASAPTRLPAARSCSRAPSNGQMSPSSRRCTLRGPAGSAGGTNVASAPGTAASATAPGAPRCRRRSGRLSLAQLALLQAGRIKGIPTTVQ